MTRHTLRSRLWLWVIAFGALAQPLYAQVPAGSVGVRTYTGYYNDTAVYFASFETNNVGFAATNGIAYAPRLTQINASALPQMIFFMNSSYPQTVVLQTAPGQPDYSPLWQVVTAQWTGTDAMPLVTNFAAAQHLASQGQLSMNATGIIFNGPVFRVNRSLSLQDTGTLAPTISPNEFLAIDPSSRTAYFMGHAGYYNDQPVTFLGLETSVGEISHAPGAIPVTTITTTALGSAAMANFYAVDGQAPVLDSVPVAPSATLLGGVVPGYVGTAAPATAPATLYSPIWSVSHVSFNTGVQPQLLRSVQEIQAAAAAGLVTITPGHPEDTFNCPIVAYAQPAATTPTPTTTTPTPTPTPTTGGTTPPTTGY